MFEYNGGLSTRLFHFRALTNSGEFEYEGNGFIVMRDCNK